VDLRERFATGRGGRERDGVREGDGREVGRRKEGKEGIKRRGTCSIAPRGIVPPVGNITFCSFGIVGWFT